MKIGQNSGRVGFFSVAIGISVMLANPAAGQTVILDGTFVDPIGTGFAGTPWSDYTNAGATKHMTSGLPGYYVGLPNGTDLYQRLLSPTPGNYNLSFLIRNESTNDAELITAFQEPLGFGAHDFEKVVSVSPSGSFSVVSLPVHLTRPAGSDLEFYFSQSFDSPDPSRGFQNSINPSGTIIDVANVSFTAATPEPATWAMMLIGLVVAGWTLRRRSAVDRVTTSDV